MLKKRIIPTLLVKHLGLYKGKKFLSDRNVGALLPSINTYNMRDVDEMIVLDIEATKNNHAINIDLVKEISENCFVPLTFGGGINNIEQVRKLFKYGADKIVVNTYLYENLSFISDIVSNFGSQSLVASVDVKKIDTKWICFSNNGSINKNFEVLDWCKKIENYGVGEIMLCSIDKDGLLEGYDQELIEYVSKNINVPLIASGGANNYEDFERALNNGASAVAASSIYLFTHQTPLDVKEYLHSKGISVRKPLKN